MKKMLTKTELTTNQQQEQHQPKLDLKPPPKRQKQKKPTIMTQKPRPDKANSPKITDIRSFLAKKKEEKQARILAASQSPDPGPEKSSTSGNDRVERPTIFNYASSGHTLPNMGAVQAVVGKARQGENI